MDANDLNKRLKELMDGLSVKVRAASQKDASQGSAVWVHRKLLA